MKINLKTAISKIKDIKAGRFFKVVFIKRTNGERREMLCRTGVQKYLRGGQQAYEPNEKNLIFVWDAERFDRLTHKGMPENERLLIGQGCFRSINVETIIELHTDGVDYEITHDDPVPGNWKIVWKNQGTECVRYVKAQDEDQAKMMFKRELGLTRMPQGARIERF